MNPRDDAPLPFDTLSRLADGDSSLVRLIEASLAFEAFNRLPVALFVLDAEGRFVLSEGGALRRMRRAPGQSVGSAIGDLYANYPDVLNVFAEVMRGGSIESRIVVGDTVYQVSARAIVHEGKVEGVIGAAFDITEQQRNEQLFARVIQHSTDAIVVASSAGQILHFNPAAELVFGYRAAEVLHTPVMRLIPSRFRERSIGVPGPRLFVREAVLGRWMRVQGLRSDGSEFPLDLRVSEIEWEPEPLAVGVMRDATQDEANRRWRETLIASVSHEFRTPIAAIAMFADLARSVGGVPQDVLEYLDVVDRNVYRLERLVEDLLLLGRDEEELQAVEEEVALPSVVADAVTLARPTASVAQLLLEFQSEDGPVIRGDPVRLGQLFDNLIGNAVKFTPAGGWIRVRCEADGGQWVVSVANSGPSIATGELGTLFEPFTRGARAVADGVPGKGLGLAIARTIVEGHGGTIEALTSPRDGVTFVVRLPFGRPGASAATIP